VPSQDAIRRERAVVEQAASSLRSSTGLRVDIDGWPDQEPGRYPVDLTVEAVLTLSDDEQSVQWAVDVMGVGWNSRLGTSVADMHDELLARLTAVATAAGHGLVVSYAPVQGGRKQAAAYIDSVVDAAAEALASAGGADGRYTMDAQTQIHVLRSPRAAGDEPVHLAYTMVDTPDVAAQLRSTLVPPLLKKLDRQMRRAHAAGYPTMLLLDRQGGDPRAGGNWIASSSTIGQVVGQAIAQHGHATNSHVIDLVLLIQGDTTAPIYGYPPRTPDPTGGFTSRAPAP
jgi:pimeloyl-ACP methyl ester carboxylesterase